MTTREVQWKRSPCRLSLVVAKPALQKPETLKKTLWKTRSATVSIAGPVSHEPGQPK